MESYLIYIGKVSLAAGAFYIVFLLLFQNQKQFVFNRFYLPVSLALSFVIPLITFTTVKYIEPTSFDFNSFAYLGDSSENIVQAEFAFEWNHYLFGLYVLGAAGFLFHLLFGHLKAISMVKKSQIRQIFETRVNITPKDVHPFSFFNKIVLSEKTLDNPNLKMIVNHENIHVKEKHTHDILFAEILFLFQWFNPFAWLIKDAVKNNLEYITDQQIAESNNPQIYQLAMVGLADKKGVAPFLTAMNGSQLKNRIIMMKKKTENKYAILKQLVVFPLLAILVMGLANKETITEVIQPETKNNVTGIVVSIETKQSIEGVGIYNKFGDKLAATNSKGEFAFKFENKKDNILFIKEGFKLKHFELDLTEKDETFLEIELEAADKNNNKKIIKGKVTDQNGDPISGASIIVRGKTIGTITDPSGNYEIELEEEKETLIFIITGFVKEEIEVGEKTEINVTLIAEYNQKSEELNVSSFKSQKLNAEQLKKYGGEIFYKVEEMPEFPGGELALKKYIASNVKYPAIAQENGIQGKVYVTFIIDKKGKVNDVQISRGVDPDLDKEAIRVISSLPKWKPGKQRGKTVNVSYTIPITFGLQDKSQTNDTTSRKPPRAVKVLSYGNDDFSEPLYIVNGIETNSLENIDPNDIENISVLKDKSATELYGEKGKNGVILVTTKKPVKFNPGVPGNPIVIVDGQEFDGDINDIPVNDISSVSVLKNSDATDLYGGKGRNGVISIITKKETINKKTADFKKFLISIEVQENKIKLQGLSGCSYKELTFSIEDNHPVAINQNGVSSSETDQIHSNFLFKIEKVNNQIKLTGISGTAWKTLSFKPIHKKHLISEKGISIEKFKEKPLIVIDGIITAYESMDDIDPETIESINVLKDEPAIKKYGDKGKNGVIEITLKQVTIATALDLRKFIAEEIRYPVLAQEANREKTVQLFAQIDKRGRIIAIKEKSTNNKLILDEVVVTAYKSKKIVVTGYGTRKEAENARKIEEQLLVDETKRIIKKIPEIDIPELKGKTIAITVKFVLQD